MARSSQKRPAEPNTEYSEAATVRDLLSALHSLESERDRLSTLGPVVASLRKANMQLQLDLLIMEGRYNEAESSCEELWGEIHRGVYIKPDGIPGEIVSLKTRLVNIQGVITGRESRIADLEAQAEVMIQRLAAYERGETPTPEVTQ